MAWQGSEHAATLARRPTLTASARDDVSEPRGGTKKRASRSNKETDEGQTTCRSGELLDKKAPYKETGARKERKAARQSLWGFECRGRVGRFGTGRCNEAYDGEAADG
jgi:hypothetical protein